MQLRQFGDQDTQKRGSVDDKVCCVIFCIETCQEVSVKVGGKRQCVRNALQHFGFNQIKIDKYNAS